MTKLNASTLINIILHPCMIPRKCKLLDEMQMIELKYCLSLILKSRFLHCSFLSMVITNLCLVIIFASFLNLSHCVSIFLFLLVSSSFFFSVGATILSAFLFTRQVRTALAVICCSGLILICGGYSIVQRFDKVSCTTEGCARRSNKLCKHKLCSKCCNDGFDNCNQHKKKAIEEANGDA